MSENKYFPLLVLIITGIITIAVYWPGLHSGFYLDDFPNLSPLGQVNEQGILPYILGGVSSPLGRPLSLATFVLQHNSWPGDPFAFKLVNLAIHLLNGLLIYIACRMLVNLAAIETDRRHAISVSLITAALWLLHPIQVNTVLYTVQRMTELSALFVLSGYIIYLAVRNSLAGTVSSFFFILAGTGIWLMLCLAVLSKENGILLPLFILITEFTLLSSIERSPGWKIWACIFLGAPLFSMAVYLFLGVDDVLRSYQFRDYMAGDRLFTQGGVLLTYTKNLLLPQLSAFSIFTDDYPVVKNWFQMSFAMTGTIVISLALLFAVFRRKSMPVISFGILWFLGGHLLESSHLNLEMYFDHRNYLPSFGIFLVVGWLWCRLFEKHKMIAATGGLFYLLLIVIVTYSNTTLWANTDQFLQSGVRNHPLSVRARTYLLNSYIKSGNIKKAKNELEAISDQFPGSLYPEVKLLAINACLEKKTITFSQWESLYARAKKAMDTGFDNLSALNNIAFLSGNGYCNSLDRRKMIDLLIILAGNDNLKHWRSGFYEIAAALSATEGNVDALVKYVNSANRHGNSVPNRIAWIEILLSMNRQRDAEELLYSLEKYLDKHTRLAIAWHMKLSSLEKSVTNKNE